MNKSLTLQESVKTLGDIDLHLLGEGRHWSSYKILGAHVEVKKNKEIYTRFAVWAPHAKYVSVIGDFNSWDLRAVPMRPHGASGFWEAHISSDLTGQAYKFAITTFDGRVLYKSDPYGKFMQQPPDSASIVVGPDQFKWTDHEWMGHRKARQRTDQPMSILEVHLGSWRRPNGHLTTYVDLAESIVDYACSLGFTHIECLPIAEHPFTGSWGYQPTGPYAPTSRFGSPDALKWLIDRAHDKGLGIILDWVPSHFPNDVGALAMFDGQALYEYANPQEGIHPDWDTHIFNFTDPKVVNFLISNAIYWAKEFHIDGLRVDAVASMLYKDYSRRPGEFVPNHFGGRENLEAIDFLKNLNNVIHAEAPAGLITIAEESTSWPRVTAPVDNDGLGFDYKWNMGWMHDSLDYIKHDPFYRKYHHRNLTFGITYAWSENFVLPLSHDEVVHLKKSLLSKMPGGDFDRFANLRLLYAWQWAYPGKKLLFMGGEFAAHKEWNHDTELDWGLLSHEKHHGINLLVRDLNHLYRSLPALHKMDCDHGGFKWIDCDDAERSIIAFWRFGGLRSSSLIVVINLTPVDRPDFLLGVPQPGIYKEIINTDSHLYGGANRGNLGTVRAKARPHNGCPFSISAMVPGLSAIILQSHLVLAG
jgi:1,4-alpha-glucan branching enzyme